MNRRDRILAARDAALEAAIADLGSLFGRMRAFIAAAGGAVSLVDMRRAFPGEIDNTLRTTAARLAREPATGIKRLGNGQYWCPDAVASAHGERSDAADPSAARLVAQGHPGRQAEDAGPPAGVGGDLLRHAPDERGLPVGAGPGDVPGVGGRRRAEDGGDGRAGDAGAAARPSTPPEAPAPSTRLNLRSQTLNVEADVWAALKRLARAQRRSMHGLVREGIVLVVRHYERNPPSAPPSPAEILAGASPEDP